MLNSGCTLTQKMICLSVFLSQFGCLLRCCRAVGTRVTHGERQTEPVHANLVRVQRSLFKGNTLCAFIGLKQVAERQHREVQMVK